MAKSLKKECHNGLPCNGHYEFISWKPMILKSPIGFKYPILLINPIRITGFHNAKKPQYNELPIFGEGHKRRSRQWLRQLWSQWRRQWHWQWQRAVAAAVAAVATVVAVAVSMVVAMMTTAVMMVAGVAVMVVVAATATQP
jgi:hypothetical protein